MPSNPPSTTDDPSVPTHVAIIMDGNGRWATQRHLPRAAGHRRGAQAAKETVLAALELGIKYLTLYSFSSENWKRSTDEVSDLMGLLRYTMQQEQKAMAGRGVRLLVIGDREPLPQDVRDTINKFEAATAHNDQLTVIIALSYGSRAEIARAARLIAAKAAAGKLDPETIDEQVFGQHLYTAGIPDPDLLIRTSGELRISNFLLWQLAYSEFVFPDLYWPDFGREALTEAVASYQQRDRRFGGRRAS